MEIPAIYSGRFTSDEIETVLVAAAPIPTDPIEDEDVVRRCKRMMPRAEAIIRRLEILDGMASINKESQKTPPSVHTKSLHAIAAAANELLAKFGVGGGRRL